MGYSDEIRTLRKSVDIVAAIGEYVPLKKKGSDDEWVGLCPFHEESTPSFSVTRSNGLFHCFGCGESGDAVQFLVSHLNLSIMDAVEKLGKWHASQSAPSELKISRPSNPSGRKPTVVDTYLYTDASGKTIRYGVDRVEPGKNGNKKDFFFWHLDEAGQRVSGLGSCEKVLYRLDEVVAASTVIVVEGEKDVETLRKHGFVATTNCTGANSKWLPSYTEALKGKRVVIIQDADMPGRKHGAEVHEALKGVCDATLTEMPGPGKDVTDWFEAGHTAEELRTLLDNDNDDPFKSIEQIVTEFPGGLEAFINPSKRAPGVPFPWEPLNRATGGMHPSELILIAARPGVGKSSMMLQMAKHAARQGYDVPVLSLEMDSASLLQRLVADVANVDMGRYLHQELTTDESRRIARALGEISANLSLGISDDVSMTVDGFVDAIARRKRRRNIGFVAVDYLGLLSGQGGENRTQEVARISRSLKLAAKKLKLPVVALSQLSRPKDREGLKPVLEDLRDSGALEQDADVVILLHQPPNQYGGAIPTELILAKQRQGPRVTIQMQFLSAYLRFEVAAFSGEQEPQ